MATTAKTPEKKSQNFTFTGKHMLILIFAFFGTIIFANGMLIKNALRSFPGEDVKKSYRQGLAYNETLEARSAQRALNWNANIHVTKSNVITLDIVDEQNLSVRGLTVSGILKHPTRSDQDTNLVFQQDQKTGQYTSQLANGFIGKRMLITHAVYANTTLSKPIFETRNEIWKK